MSLILNPRLRVGCLLLGLVLAEGDTLIVLGSRSDVERAGQ